MHLRMDSLALEVWFHESFSALQIESKDPDEILIA